MMKKLLLVVVALGIVGAAVGGAAIRRGRRSKRAPCKMPRLVDCRVDASF
jgi:hypothetical protein